ncbi:MAG: peptidoglycan-binding domain-containing protein, partial [bacterium]
MRNNDVLQLQKFLNNNGFTIAKTGVGSKGKETTYFGPATKAALVRFQKSVGLPNTGFFGGMTRGVVGK